MPPTIDQLKQMRVCIHGELYTLDNEHDTIDGNPSLQVGDMVLDLRDGCYGCVEHVHDDTIAVHDAGVTEVAPRSALVKLRLIDDKQPYTTR